MALELQPTRGAPGAVVPPAVPPPSRPARRGAADAAPAAALLLLLLAAWELAVRALDVPGFLLPAPSRVWAALVELRPVLGAHVASTVTTAVAGLALAAVAGVALAVALTSVPLVRRVLYPLLVVSQTIPMIVLAPLLIVWFGFGLLPKVLVVALVGFFPVVVSTADALDGADRDLLDAVRSMGAGRGALLRHVRIPAALPGFFAGLTIAASYAMVGAVIAEWMGAQSGLGLLLTRSEASFRIDRTFAGIALVAGVSIALFAAVRLAARLATPWRAAELQERRR
jgi:ABC-type nitrate/sulfonate/bicarbonate transport system permease component